jgi:hypothetical protein
MKKSLITLSLFALVGTVGLTPANSYETSSAKPVAAHLGLSYSITDANQSASGDEYFYRLTNQDGDLVDSASASGMVGPLTEKAQDDYYVEKLGYKPNEYDWAWTTFICVSNNVITDEVPGINTVVTEAPKSATLAEYNAFWSDEDFIAPQGVLETFQTVSLDNNYQPSGTGFPSLSLADGTAENRMLVSKHSAIATCSDGTPTVATLGVDGEALTPRTFDLNQNTQALVNGSYRSIDLQGRYVAVYGIAPPSEPAPYAGPLITNINNATGAYSTYSGEEIKVYGERLSSINKVFINNLEGEVVSTSDDHFVMITPEGLTAGSYDLMVESSIGNLTYLGAFVVTEQSANRAVAMTSCEGVEPSWWTQRISDSQAKAYIKCPAEGQKYRILQQTGGSGDYDSVFVKTLTDENDSTQVFNEFGRYIVRTIELEDINRIRITVDDEELWKVRYNR